MNKPVPPIVADYWKHIDRAEDKSFSIETRMKHRAAARRCLEVMTPGAERIAHERNKHDCKA